MDLQPTTYRFTFMPISVRYRWIPPVFKLWLLNQMSLLLPQWILDYSLKMYFNFTFQSYKYCYIAASSKCLLLRKQNITLLLVILAGHMIIVHYLQNIDYNDQSNKAKHASVNLINYHHLSSLLHQSISYKIPIKFWFLQRE